MPHQESGQMINSFEHFSVKVHALKGQFDNSRRLLIARNKQTVFRFAPFSSKQRKILTWWQDNTPVKDKDGIIADGAIRSGKTISMSLSFGLWAMHNFNNQKFLICGKTIGSLRRNVISDWAKIMKSLGYSLKEVRNENLVIISKGEAVNEFYLFGGRDERSQDLVQGITAAGVFFDEVALMPESFVNQATARCSITGSKFWFNCNPEGPLHWFKVNWINKIKGIDPTAVFTDEHPAKNLIYLHFTMDDNLSLAEEIKERYRTQWTGVFYERYIKGFWSVASGVVYDMFNMDLHVLKGDTGHITGQRYISIDYGTINPMVFLDIIYDGKKVYVLREYYYNSREEQKQKTDKEYADDLKDFIGQNSIRTIIIDPSAASFKAEMKSKGIRKVTDANNTVLDGIRMVGTMLNLESLYIHENCTNTINEFHNYMWNEKSAERGVEEPVKQSDHAMDALRYFVSTILKGRRFTRRG